MTAGQHRMKRRKPDVSAGPVRPVSDIRKAYTPEQLAEIGAIALIWNQIELQIDFILLVILKLRPTL